MKEAYLCLSGMCLISMVIKTSTAEPWWGLLLAGAIAFAGFARSMEK